MTARPQCQPHQQRCSFKEHGRAGDNNLDQAALQSLPGKSIMTRASSLRQRRSEVKQEIKSVGQGPDQQGTGPELSAAPKQRWGAPSEHFLTLFFLNYSAANSHSCTISELEWLFLEDNGKQLSIPLVCLQAEN